MNDLDIPKSLTVYLLRLPPAKRRLFLIGLDLLLLPLAVWLSFWLRFAHPFHPNLLTSGSWLLAAVIAIGLPLYCLTGQYTGLTRYVGSRAFYTLAVRNGILVLFIATTGFIFGFPMPPRSSWILLWLLVTGLTAALRFVFRDLLLNLRSTQHKQHLRVVIYGAGEAGVQLSLALRFAGNYKILTFIDDNPAYWSRTINGVAIQPPQALSYLKGSIDQVLLAIPSLPRTARRRILDDLQFLGIPVLQVPSVDDLTFGRARIDALRPIAIEDLLGRDVVPADPKLLSAGIRDRVVCVTGAGGSIGSELCRQILALSPSRLILLDNSEPSSMPSSKNFYPLSLKVLPFNLFLGMLRIQKLLLRLFSDHSVQLVFHAAAYKHVPLVEANPLAGLTNNVLSTFFVCESALATGVHEVVLVSTDKAVRPTNVMGASKRLAELVLQALLLKEAALSSPWCVLAMSWIFRLRGPIV